MSRPRPRNPLKGRDRRAEARQAEAAALAAGWRGLDEQLEQTPQALDEGNFGRDANRPCSAKYRALAGLLPLDRSAGSHG